MKNIERRIEVPELGLVTVAPIAQSNPADQITPELYARQMERIGRVAWVQADWTTEIIPDAMERESTIRRYFDESDPAKLKAREWMIEAGLDNKGEAIGLVGIFEGETRAPERMLGFAALQTEVSPAYVAQDDIFHKGFKAGVRGFKRISDETIGRIRPGRVYSVIRNMQVDPEVHGQAGTALLYGVLQNAVARRAVTAYVDYRNGEMRELLENNGFYATNDEDSLQHDWKPLPGYELQYLRYMSALADRVSEDELHLSRISAKETYEHMAFDTPWLEK